ncbi:hypothetical protein [Gracilibacillus thailandensis]|uniref:Uncharacterized protein n=1 Tax=Gracilibacillus thailandensis TaxID=563735 RepID=A0A6N7QVL7_9BACI|nr:hypothetical protein [Gracilibacillus thailandensis]MRI66167.1 hypothetical protein [Gracilibacillus thailandensis]
MLKKSFKCMLVGMLVIVLSLTIFPFDQMTVHAASLPDGDATGSSYSPHKVTSSIKNTKLSRWNKADKDLSFTSKRKLAYDIYSGVSGQSKKQAWKVENKNFGKGKQPYLTFTGWSAMLGYRHHTRDNQATYIRAINKKTGEQKTYKAKMTKLSASLDVAGYRTSSTLTNVCSNGARDRSNTGSNSCNMKYDWVGFKAYLPLNELFPNGTRDAEWEMYLIKRVGTSGSYRTLYDDLRIPYNINKLSYNDGKLNLSSGVNNNVLVMNGDHVIRRSSPRGLKTYTPRYFIKGRAYTRVTQNEDWTAIWYGVRNSGTFYTASPYWTFGGDRAILSYSMNKKSCPDGSTVYVDQDCRVNVTINHIDADTGKKLKTNKSKATVGKNYSYSPVSRGTFKDKDGNPYVAYPSDQKKSGKTPNSNMTINFYYRVALPDPTTIKEISNGTVGKAKGDFLWRLEKADENNDSRLRLLNTIEIDGTHYRTRNKNYTVSSTRVINETDSNPINVYVSNPNALKNRNIEYTFEYEYTNHYKQNYKCVDQQGDDCFEWKFDKNTPVWGEYANTAKWEETLKADHRYGETFIFNGSSSPTTQMVIGRKATVDGKESSTIDKDVQRESYTVNNAPIMLLSQNWIPINETIEYSTDFDNPFYIIPENMYYYPNDVDDTLKEDYQNETSFVFSDYAIPLRVGSQEDDELTFNTKDNFFITKETGFIFSLPSSVTSTLEINDKAKEKYEDYTGEEFNDEVLNGFAKGSRYYFNIDGNGEEKPNTWYQHVYLISKLGLSDIQIQIRKNIEFDKYLIGSPMDNALISEEYDRVLHDLEDYDNSVVITYEQQQQIKALANERGDLIHSFRSSDIQRKYNQLKNILPSLPD